MSDRAYRLYPNDTEGHSIKVKNSYLFLGVKSKFQFFRSFLNLHPISCLLVFLKLLLYLSRPILSCEHIRSLFQSKTLNKLTKNYFNLTFT